ncbi:(Fe-S)-binding protein [Calditerricola satsumensis]|uniref:Glycolate oxidase iron-sulfur subunit n=4 Tax=Calditerricola satsumensis TaxID=373054 RepID=A0A8J3B5T8_9BACI|nr:putative glycolate oxidase iron-sulfur subunit [Calditerricola satsumensis]
MSPTSTPNPNAMATSLETKEEPSLEARTARLWKHLQEALDADELENCMRCGFCQPACPTFQETGYEAASPRGRIALMKAVKDGFLVPDEAFRSQLDLCLGCRACEPACPSGVRYGRLLEQAREALAAHAPTPWPIRLARKVVFAGVFPHPRRLQRLGRLLRFYQTSGLQRVVRKSGLLRLLPAHLRDMEAVLPVPSPRGVVETIGTRIPAKGAPVATVGLFRGCVMDVLYTETNVNLARLLSEAGFEVIIPPEQTCCGALHAHTGDTALARQLARRNIAAFRRAGVDFVVLAAGGCGAMLQEYAHLLPDDEGARWMGERVRDASQLLASCGRPLPLGRVEATVTYQDSCHLRNVMGVHREVRQLLSSIPGVTFRELPEADRCCGSAGVYNLTQPEMAGRILERKMGHVARLSPDLVATGNPGCLLQMQLGLHRAGLDGAVRAMHWVDVVAEALDAAPR